jgi:hypothetical protein
MTMNRRGISFQLYKLTTGFETPVEPMLEDQAVLRLKRELSRSRFYVEFGSGGSTIMADELRVNTLSVEPDPFYAKAVRGGLKNGTVKIITPQIGPTGMWGYPIIKRPEFLAQALWRRYVMTPFSEPAFPDLVLVDGRFRVACAQATALEAKRRGAKATLLIDDYAGRPRYHSIEQFLGKPEMVGRLALFQVGNQTVPELGKIAID